MNAASAFFRDGRQYPTQAQLNAAIDELAEHLSRGRDLAEASDRMEVSRGTGTVLFHHMRERLGPQAI